MINKVAKSLVAILVIATLAIFIMGYALESIWRKDADADSRRSSV